MRLFHKYIWAGRVLCLACGQASQAYIHAGIHTAWHDWRHHKEAKS